MSKILLSLLLFCVVLSYSKTSPRNTWKTSKPVDKTRQEHAVNEGKIPKWLIKKLSLFRSPPLLLPKHKHTNLTENKATSDEHKLLKPVKQTLKIMKHSFKTKEDNVFKARQLPKWLLQQASKYIFLSTFQMVTWLIRQKNKEKEEKFNRSGKNCFIW